MTDLERRLQRVEDTEQIRALKAYYAKCADEKYTAAHERLPQKELDVIALKQASVFTEDAIWDGGEQFGVCYGREQIYDSLRQGPWKFAMHYFLSPLIEINGDTALARWMLWQPATIEKGNRPILMSAITDDEYLRTGNGWKISRMLLTLKFITDYDTPWSRYKDTPLAKQIKDE